jgi:hypothetical protein
MMQPRTLPGGRRAWLDGEVADFVDAMMRLDDRLALVQTVDGRWEIWRCAEDGSEHMVCRSPVGAKLTLSVLERLAQGDTRRHDVVEKMIRQNDLAEKHRLDAQEEAHNVAVDRLLSRVWKGHVPSNVEDLNL